MVVLLIILPLTIGLYVRAWLYVRRLRLAGSDATDGGWLFDTLVRSFLMVLLALLGLLALGAMYSTP